jgi:glycosyltransferase involved in cell wall biosynthesis
MPRLVQIVHGFPPRENAGTERVAARAADALRARGWEVHTLAATRAPGEAMYSTFEEPHVSRLVTNAPFASLRLGGADPAARAWIESRLQALSPDVVHVHHLANLDPDFRTHAPMVWTLHDAWAWCAAGGQLMREGAACAGPGPDCAACATAWCQDGPAVALALGVAGRLAPLVAPSRLHRLWGRLPAAWRSAATRGASPVTAEQIDARTGRWQRFAARCAVRIAPSRWIGEEAARRGLGTTLHLPNGVSPGPARVGGGPFLFLGTLAHHKGPDLVVAAHTRAGVDIPLLLHGPPGPDAAYAAALPHSGPIADPSEALARAAALVLGSRWPENAPLVVLEARAAGCPVIAPDVGGLRELVEPGVDGWLYEVGNVEALAACIRSAVATPRPPVRPPLSMSEHADRLVGVYDSLR